MDASRWGMAGVASGLAGLVTFLVIHAIWIQPIWEIVPIGALIAALGGWLTVRCYAHAAHLLSGRVASYLLVFTGVALTLIPRVLITLLLPPLLEVENGEVARPLNVSWLVGGFFSNLFIPTAAAGIAMGWLLTRRRATAGLFASMGLLMGLGPGHNIPLFGSGTMAQWGMLLTLTFVPMAVAAVVLVEGVRLASRRSSPAAEPRTP